MTLIGYWPLNENSGSKAYDHSGNENHGTLNGGVTQGTTGLLADTAYSFDGSDDYVSIADSSVLDGSPISATAWVKTSASGEKVIVAKFNSSSPYNGYWYGQGKDGGIRVCLGYDGQKCYEVSDFPNDGNWHQICFTYDNSTLKIYQDGKHIDSISETTDVKDTATDLQIGYGQWGVENEWNGKISEVRIYDRPLTKSEVQYLYNVGKRGLHTTSRKTS
ncbi:LamG domain-containing protein [Candidatus Nanosalina sp. VS9-1]|uniref:LamG domain-containing protein n=1 Tax=Candidatus Nanosalina sp. VS9-1 TaxID=3388566 RepID=UPI0039DF6DC4